MKSLPNDCKAEASILGAILLRNEAVSVVDTLSPEDFYDPRNRAVFQAIRELEAKGLPIDPVTVEDRLAANGVEAVTLGYLSDLVGVVPTADNIGYYGDIVTGHSQIRRVILACSDLVSRGYDASDPTEYMDLAERTMQEVCGSRGGVGPQSLTPLMKQAMAAIYARSSASGGVTGVPSGFPDLDALTGGWQPSDLVILGARPAMGKTSLALNLATNAALAGIPALVFSMEMSAVQIADRLLFSEARVDATRVRGGHVTKGDFTAFTAAGDRLATAPLKIDDSHSLTPTEVRARARRWKADRSLFKASQVGLVVVDYLQLMRCPGLGKGSNREQEISEISRSLKGLAKELGLPVVALSQLNRGLEARADKRPVLSDLRESGAIEQDADLVMFLYRDEVYNKGSQDIGVAELSLAKHRSGPTGVVKLRFNSNYTRFDNLAKGYDF